MDEMTAAVQPPDLPPPVAHPFIYEINTWAWLESISVEEGKPIVLGSVPWTTETPDIFVQGTAADRDEDPASFVEVGGRVLANGRDPYFPAWPDVVQLNAFAPALRTAAAETLRSIADQCDGVRCDMAMLVMNDVFASTWGARVGPAPGTEYWPTVIDAVRETHPGFVFLAEAYWDLEWSLMQQGFDYCYDKRLYDRLLGGNAEEVRLHLQAEPAYQNALVRFVENHDEPRAASAFGAGRAEAAAVAALTQTGARLIHHGQLLGWRVRLPVFLGRFPNEPTNDQLAAFYRRLLTAVADPTFRGGHWQPCERSGWPGALTTTDRARSDHRFAVRRDDRHPRAPAIRRRRASRHLERSSEWPETSA
jgi:hypothetical protein